MKMNTALKRLLKLSASFKRGIFFLLLVSSLMSCALMGSKWDNAWPTYRNPPLANSRIALVETKDVFTLMRAKWYANKFNVTEESSYEHFGVISDSIVKHILKSYYPTLEFLPSETRKKFVEETIRFDKTIFLKGKFPEQGKSVQGNDSIPDFLLLIHEITLGTDLNKEYFFDYDLKQNEMDTHKTVEKMSVILTFSLWDNKKQIPLYSSILEEHLPVKYSPNANDVEKLLTSIVSKIPFEIAKGAK